MLWEKYNQIHQKNNNMKANKFSNHLNNYHLLKYSTLIIQLFKFILACRSKQINYNIISGSKILN